MVEKEQLSMRAVTTGGLAGAAMLAAGSQGYANIVVVPTPPDLLHPATPGPVPGPGAFDPQVWDIDGDGTNDAGFNYRSVDQPPWTWQANYYGLMAGQGVVGYVGPFAYDYGSNLAYGTVIGPASTLVGTAGVAGTPDQVFLGSDYAGGMYGGFGNPANSRGFIGLQFTIGANTHYAWVDVEIANGLGIIFHGAAYEDTPGTAIAAGAIPAPGTLAFLALGAAGALGRRKRKA